MPRIIITVPKNIFDEFGSENRKKYSDDLMVVAAKSISEHHDKSFAAKDIEVVWFVPEDAYNIPDLTIDILFSSGFVAGFIPHFEKIDSIISSVEDFTEKYFLEGVKKLAVWVRPQPDARWRTWCIT